MGRDVTAHKLLQLTGISLCEFEKSMVTKTRSSNVTQRPVQGIPYGEGTPRCPRVCAALGREPCGCRRSMSASVPLSSTAAGPVSANFSRFGAAGGKVVQDRLCPVSAGTKCQILTTSARRIASHILKGTRSCDRFPSFTIEVGQAPTLRDPYYRLISARRRASRKCGFPD